MWVCVWKTTKSDAVHGKHYRRGASEPPHVPRCHLVDVPLYQVFQLPQSVSPTSWILDTHYAFLEQRSRILRPRNKQDPKPSRYGGWREGLESNSSVPANSENSAVYFNNKVCEMIVILVERNFSFVQMLGITRNGCTCDSGYNL